MPYDITLDPYGSTSGFGIRGRRLTTVTASGSDFASYPKALTVHVPAGTAGPHLTILPLGNADGDTIALTLNESYQIYSEVGVRAVTAITAGVTVRRIDD